MRSALPALLISAALAAATAVNAAQQPSARQHPPGGGAASPMMGAHAGMGRAGCLAMSDERLEAVKRDLDVTPAQTPRWNAFADAVRSNARVMGEKGPMDSMGHMGGGGTAPHHGMTLPERLEMHERMMAQHLEALRRVKAPLLSLYDALTPAQKAKADTMCGPQSDKSHAQ